MSRQTQTTGGGYGVAIAVSVVLHLSLIVAVVWGWESAEQPPNRVVPKYVEAKLVTLKPKVTKTAPAKKPKVVNLAEKRKQQALRAKEKQRKLDQQKRRKAQQKIKEQQAALKKAAELKAAKEKAAKEDARKQELLAQERAQKIAQQQQFERESAFADALAQEEAMLQQEQDVEQARSYIGHIAQLIEQNWSRPPSARLGMQCELTIQLIPTGEVIHVSVSKSSGNPAFDRSAEQAVKKAGRFDVLKDVPPVMFDQFFRQLTLRFNPQDLRL